MKRLVIALALVSLSLGACKSLTPPEAQVAVAKGDYAFEATYNAAAQLYLAEEANLPADVKATAKSVLLQLLDCPQGAAGACTGYVVTARTAAAAGDATTLATQIAQITALSGQVTAMISATHKAKGP
jgi:hypothetical protein